MYRSMIIAAAVAAVMTGAASSADARTIGSTVKAVSEQRGAVEPAACGSRGGPGGREANGKCASWGKGKRRK